MEKGLMTLSLRLSYRSLTTHTATCQVTCSPPMPPPSSAKVHPNHPARHFAIEQLSHSARHLQSSTHPAPLHKRPLPGKVRLPGNEQLTQPYQNPSNIPHPKNPPKWLPDVFWECQLFLFRTGRQGCPTQGGGGGGGHGLPGLGPSRFPGSEDRAGTSYF